MPIILDTEPSQEIHARLTNLETGTSYALDMVEMEDLAVGIYQITDAEIETAIVPGGEYLVRFFEGPANEDDEDSVALNASQSFSWSGATELVPGTSYIINSEVVTTSDG